MRFDIELGSISDNKSFPVRFVAMDAKGFPWQVFTDIGSFVC
jgi:hypothetical protein